MALPFVVGVLVPETTSYSHFDSRLLDFTVTSTRFDYQGPLQFAADARSLLEQAAERNARYCLIQSAGHAVARHHGIRASSHGTFFELLRDWVDAHEFLVAGDNVSRQDGAVQLDSLCFVVDVAAYIEKQRPQLPIDHPVPVTALSEMGGFAAFDDVVRLARFDLRSPEASSREGFKAFWGGGIFSIDLEGDARLTADQRAFVSFILGQATRAKEGVFLINWENYADVDRIDAQAGGIDALFSVAAGFKPLRILEARGVGPGTRMVYFDYSKVALDIRKMMVEEWNGRDFEDFVGRIESRFPGAWYQIKGSRVPGRLDRDAIAALWQRELDLWGGASDFARQWQRAAGLEHQFVQCDLYGDTGPLLSEMSVGERNAIWWSNSFHSRNAIWFYERDVRHGRYYAWLEALEKVGGDVTVFGADVENLPLGSLSLRQLLAGSDERRSMQQLAEAGSDRVAS